MHHLALLQSRNLLPDDLPEVWHGGNMPIEALDDLRQYRLNLWPEPPEKLARFGIKAAEAHPDFDVSITWC
jgi:hypothetical protein